MVEELKNVKNDIIQRFSLQKYLYLILSIIDIVSCVVFVIYQKNYYSIFLFAAVLVYLVYEFFLYDKLLKKENYVITKMRCNGISRSYFGYGMTNSKIYNFEILEINSENPKKYCKKWEEENDLSNTSIFEPTTDLQFIHNYKLTDVIKSKRGENVNKFSKNDIVWGVFLTNPKRPLTFTNATLIYSKPCLGSEE